MEQASSPSSPAPAPRLTVRVGCHLVFWSTGEVPGIIMLKPRRGDKQLITQERLTFTPGLTATEYEDVYGNIVYRAILQPGENVIHHDALISVPSEVDNAETHAPFVPLSHVPPQYLRYTLPSRYCDSDKLMDFAWKMFGSPEPEGLERVRKICDWTHKNIEYRFGSGRPDTAASDIIAQRYGVCRDFAHVAVALCRTFNIPARYVTGHLPDIGYQDPGTAMDFHAYFEAYVGGRWITFDARFNIPRIGRVKVAHGLDAVDGAISTIYGDARMTWFEVWAYQVNPALVSVGDPVDLSFRLDGTETLRFA